MKRIMTSKVVQYQVMQYRFVPQLKHDARVLVCHFDTRDEAEAYIARQSGDGWLIRESKVYEN